MNKVQASRFTWLLLAAPLAAGAASLAGPHLGLMFDPGAKQIRPLLGIPGAATIGAPFPLTVNIERAWVAPGQDYALAVVIDPSYKVPGVHAQTSAPTRTHLDRLADLFHHDLHFQTTINSGVKRSCKDSSRRMAKRA